MNNGPISQEEKERRVAIVREFYSCKNYKERVEVAKKHGVSRQLIYAWGEAFGGREDRDLDLRGPKRNGRCKRCHLSLFVGEEHHCDPLTIDRFSTRDGNAAQAIQLHALGYSL